MVEVIIAMEEEFHMEIPDAVADNIKTPTEAAEYIYTQLHPPAADGDHGSKAAAQH